MPTIKQLIKKTFRKIKYRKLKTPALCKNSQKKGICVKIYTRTPKKPNSALRKVAKIKLSNKMLKQSITMGPYYSANNSGLL